jgi:hypothetical protein
MRPHQQRLETLTHALHVCIGEALLDLAGVDQLTVLLSAEVQAIERRPLHRVADHPENVALARQVTFTQLVLRPVR